MISKQYLENLVSITLSNFRAFHLHPTKSCLGSLAVAPSSSFPLLFNHPKSAFYSCGFTSSASLIIICGTIVAMALHNWLLSLSVCSRDILVAACINAPLPAMPEYYLRVWVDQTLPVHLPTADTGMSSHFGWLLSAFL